LNFCIELVITDLILGLRQIFVHEVLSFFARLFWKLFVRAEIKIMTNFCFFILCLETKTKLAWLRTVFKIIE
jgi:hypothetical protein